MHWLAIPNVFTAIGWVAVSFYLGFYLPVFVGLTRVAVHRLRVPVILAAPAVWTGLELVRGHLLSGFTMASLGHTQYRWIEMIQMSDLAGAYGVGFVVAFVAACLARAFSLDGRPKVLWPLVPLAAVLGAAVLYGHLRLSHEAAGPRARIALIQGDVDTVLRPKPGTRARMHRQYWQLTERAVTRYGNLDLVIWPETVFGSFLIDSEPDAVPASWEGTAEQWLDQVAKSREPMRSMARYFDTPLLLGVNTYFSGRNDEKSFNSAVYVTPDHSPDEPFERYDKMHLVAFGEYIPFAEQLSWLIRVTPLNSLNLAVTPGTRPAAFELRGLRIAPNICYESVMPQVIRRQVNTLAAGGREPDVLVNLTNDGWFFGSAELDMHLVCGVFRAVECRKPFLIAANTGFSAWIDADGRIRAQGRRRATDTVLAEVAPDHRGSMYLAYGDLPAAVCLAACLVFAAVGTWDRTLRRRHDRSPQARSGPK
jgi:apolipoprotein N-acyltransferase